MAEIQAHQPVMLLIAVCSQYDDAFRWALERAERNFGPTHRVSECFDFNQTDYYARSMGDNLRKQFLTFQPLIDPGQLRKIKMDTNRWEAEYAGQTAVDVARPVNLDPGFIALGKLVLASTKDHLHRVPLGQGIYAEVTLHFQNGSWRAHPWTYPDYQQAEFQQFFSHCREHLRAELRKQ